jgi:hypothetical protein
MPLVYAEDVLPLGGMTILFGANDSGKSTTLRVVAQRLDELMRGSRARGDCTAIMSFRHDREALEVLLGELMQQERSPTESTWTLDTLADRPRLFGVDDPTVAAQLAEAPAFALSLPSAEDVQPARADWWAVTLVRSPAHAAEIGKELLAALERRRRPYQVPLPPDAVDLASFGPPLRPHHEEPIGETALPLVPQPLSLPAGIGVALDALDAAVDRARRAFRSWAEKAELPVRLDPIEAALVKSCNDSGAWVGPDGEPDLFLLQLTGDLEVGVLELHATVRQRAVPARLRRVLVAAGPMGDSTQRPHLRTAPAAGSPDLRGEVPGRSDRVWLSAVDRAGHLGSGCQGRCSGVAVGRVVRRARLADGARGGLPLDGSGRCASVGSTPGGRVSTSRGFLLPRSGHGSCMSLPVRRTRRARKLRGTRAHAPSGPALC